MNKHKIKTTMSTEMPAGKTAVLINREEPSTAGNSDNSTLVAKDTGRDGCKGPRVPKGCIH